jgi:DNA repair protein RecO (recombination protein O)
MQITAPAIICAVRPHGENGAIVRGLCEEHGMMAGFVQGAHSRTLRPILIAGNLIQGIWRSKVQNQLPSLTVEPLRSRAHLLGEPLAIAAIDWATALTAATLPEAHPYPRLYSALDGLLSAIELAPAARDWAGAMARFEELLLIELGYGQEDGVVTIPAQTRERLVAHLLSDHHRDIMATRERLVARLRRAVA